ncbi:hypothetical protein Pelo_11893 [Pelomyxa schiedti]|nr:hypothetical protein Pelo_11893 [Pelomyxa schiedti]
MVVQSISREFNAGERKMLYDTTNFAATQPSTGSDYGEEFSRDYPFVFVACKHKLNARKMFLRDINGLAIRIGGQSPNKSILSKPGVTDEELLSEIYRLFNEMGIEEPTISRVIENYSQPILYIGSFITSYWARNQGIEMALMRPGSYFFDIGSSQSRTGQQRVTAKLVIRDVQVLDSETTKLVYHYSFLEFNFMLNPDASFDSLRYSGVRYGAWGLCNTFSFKAIGSTSLSAATEESIEQCVPSSGPASLTHAALCRL